MLVSEANSHAPRTVPTVGIGASAGGVEALQKFFGTVPPDLGLAYVVVLHLAPDRKSELPAILRRQTRMPVSQVGDHDKVHLDADHVYVIAPDRKLEVTDHSIGASAFEQPHGQRTAIDLFFRSLASAHKDGFAVVLSGSGTDGAVGAKAVKEAGGVVLVQDPSEASHDGMPRAVIATGAADVVLPVRELAARLGELARSQEQVSKTLGRGEGDREMAEAESRALERVLDLLKSRTGHDFSMYKRATVLRRLARRMQLAHCASIADYLEYLRDNVEEARRLFDDLLISVTTFFRDPEAWAALSTQVIAPLVERAGANEQLRVWVPGCATGEEAFTLAILFEEEFARRGTHGEIVIFASDVDEGALAVAREGIFLNAITADLSDERLARYFEIHDDHYRIVRSIRDRVVFATHSLLRDPPFSRVHLLSCRNLLIYLDRDMQEQVMAVFRYACRENGYLFLGASEYASGELFSTVDKKHRIFQVRTSAERSRLPELLAAPSPLVHKHELEVRAHSKQSAAEAHVEAIEEVAPPSLLVDDRWNVLHLSPLAARFLQQSAGPLARRVTDLVRTELRDELHVALHHAFERSEAVLSQFVNVAFNGTAHRVAVLVQKRPVKRGARPQVLVTFLDSGVALAPAESAAEESTTDLVHALREELRRSEQHVDRMRDDHHVTNEDLRAANEELQSLNEEYRSTTEELETSKEELQSINEELETVNNELKTKLDEVSHAHADIENLMAATDVAILFLDPDLRIKRYTPRLRQFFNVKTRDLGRPIGDVTHSLDYTELQDDARRVLSNLDPIERQARSGDGHGFIVRLIPYRIAGAETADGVVITFVDVTPLKQAESALRESERRLETELKVMRRLHDMTTTVATTIKLQEALDEILVTAIDLHEADFGHIQLFIPEQQGLRIVAQHGFGAAFLKTFESVRADEPSATGRALGSRETCRIEDVLSDPGYVPYREVAAQAGYRAVQAIPLIARSGELVGILSTYFRKVRPFSERDRHLGDLLARQAADLIAGRGQQEVLARMNEELRERTDELAGQARNKEEFLAVLGHELRNPIGAIVNGLELVRAEDGRSRRALEILRRQAQHMVRLINDLLDVTRINHGKLKIERKTIDACQCARDVVEATRSLINAKGLELRLDLPAAPLYVDADPERLAQVLGNLLRNAAGYTERGHISVSIRKQEAHARISVRDTGIGIDPADAERLFDPFSQADRGRRTGGLGLGLTLVKRLVEMHGGAVALHSDGRGTGSDFSFTIPLAESAPAAAPEAPIPLLRSRRILVVDDQPDNADMFAAMLERLGQEVQVAYGGTAALAAAKKYLPEVAFLDLSMPELGGRELANQLRRDFPKTALTLVALTGFGKDHPDARDPEFARHLLKPATVESVVELLQSLGA
jgi:two-component system CheB/CheR fusion protein